LEILEKIRYHKTLSCFFSDQYLFFDEEQHRNPNIRKCAELPFQQTKAKLWDEVTDTLCIFEFIQAKTAAKMTYELIRDFNDVLEMIPDNTENILQEKTRRLRMEKYTRDLIACAKGEIPIDELQLPESFTPWSRDKTYMETERMMLHLSRSDRLKEFLRFLVQEADNLHNHAHEFSRLAIRLALNYAQGGPVEKAAESAGAGLFEENAIPDPSSRSYWKPFPIKLKTIKEIDKRTNRLEITSDGRRALTLSGFHKDSIILWDLESGLALKKADFEHSIRSVSMTPDGRYLLMDGKENALILFDMENWIISRSIHGNMPFSVLCITPDARQAITSSDNGPMILWELKSGQPLMMVPFEAKQIPWGDYQERITDIKILPDAKKAISCSNKGEMKLWDLESGQPVRKLEIFDSFRKDWDGRTRGQIIRSVTITPDGKRAIASGLHENGLIIWDVWSDKPHRLLVGHSSYINDFDITPDGKYAVSCSNDNICRCWDVESGRILKTFTGHEAGVFAVRILPDGSKAVSGGMYENLIVWDLERGYSIY